MRRCDVNGKICTVWFAGWSHYFYKEKMLRTTVILTKTKKVSHPSYSSGILESTDAERSGFFSKSFIQSFFPQCNLEQRLSIDLGDLFEPSQKQKQQDYNG